MSTQISNHTGKTLSPLEKLISSKPGTYNSAKIEARLQDIDKRIETWKRIADFEHIDISDESSELNDISVPDGGSQKPSHVFTLLLLEGCKERICHRIVRKIKGNIKREPPKNVLEELSSELCNLTNNSVIPWIKTAETEKVDIKEETEILNAADKRSFEKLREENSNPKQTLEIVQRNLKILRTQACMRIMRKTFVKRITERAESEKSKDWLNDEREMVIGGIAADAIAALPSSENLKSMEDQCNLIFKLFNDSIALYDENPKKYHELADKEWLKREIIKGTVALLQLCSEKKDVHLAKEILSAHNLALQLLNSDMKTQEVKKKVTKLYNIYANKLSTKLLYSCGYTNMKKEGEKDLDPKA